MKRHNLTIHGLRGLLAISVVLFHVYRGMVADGYINPVENALWIETVGRVSVNLFFVISGYLIIQSLMKHGNLGDFFVNRFLRIYPVFLVIHILIFTAGPIINYEWMSDLSVSSYIFHFITNLLLLPGIFVELPAAQIVAWSVSYELLFYILMGSFFVSIRSANNQNKKVLLLLTLLASIVFTLAHPRSLFFVVGILVYSTIEKINTKRRYKPMYFLNGLIILSFITIFYDRLPLYISLVLSFLLFVSIVNEEGFLSKILQTQFFGYLGSISYSLYLWHTFAFFPIKNMLIPRVAVYNDNPTFIFIVFLVLSVSASLVVSHISYVLIEQRFTKYVKRLIARKKEVSTSKVEVV